ncbi:ABC transporter substrate-binding protein [Natrialbaceae archaeon A-gly3]
MKDGSPGFTRREYLGGIAGATTGGIAGCLGGDERIDIAYMPIYPDLQWFVMDEQGYLDGIDVDIEAQEFTDGPAIVQAYGSGDIDVALVGIVPAMNVVDRGIDARVTAANIVEPNALVAHEDFIDLWDEHGDEGAFDVWEDETGSTFQFGTFPQGSTPDVLLRFWLEEEVGVTPDDVADITELGGANALFQAIVNDEIDGGSVLEPVLTRTQRSDSPIELFKPAGEIMPGQPGAVVLMNEETRESEFATEFLEAHVRATEFIEDDPDETATIVEDRIGIPQDEAREALDGPISNFVTDPRAIEDGTETFASFAHGMGQLDEALTAADVFDYSIYDDL